MKKIIEPVLFIAALAIVLAGGFFALSYAKRTPVAYVYDESTNMLKQVEAKNETKEDEEDSPVEKEDDTENEADNDNSTSKAPSSSSKTSTNSSNSTNYTDDSNGDGPAGKQGPNGTKKQEVVTNNTPTAEPTTEPTSKPTQEPKPTKVPKDEVVELECEWDGKDEVKYGQIVNKKDLKITGTTKNGSKVNIDASDCHFVGLSTDDLGKHVAIITYGDADCSIKYTVNDYMTGLDVDIPDEVYLGEQLDDGTVTVFVVSASGENDELLTFGDYKLKLDTSSVGEKSYTVSYERFTKTGKVNVYQAEVEYTIIDEETNEKDVTREKIADINLRFKKDLTDSPYLSSKKYKDYVIVSASVKADGSNKAFPYTLRRGVKLVKVTFNIKKK